MKRFVCSSPNGSVTHSFLSSGQPSRGLYSYTLERHLGPCECSFCDRRPHRLGYLPPFGLKLKKKGGGWNIFHWATPKARWYFRWVRRGNW